MTAREIAELLRISQNRVIILARRGDLPSLSVAGRLRFDADEVEDWIKSQRPEFRRAPKLVDGRNEQ